MNISKKMFLEPLVLDSKIERRNKLCFERLYKERRGILIEVGWFEKDAPEWNQVKDFEDKEREFENIIRHYNRNVEAAKLGFHNVPVCKFDFSGVAYLMAIAYGAQLLKVNHLINAEHLYYNLEDAKRFKRIEKIKEYGVYPEIFSRMEEFQQRFGNLPIGIPDNQSPNDVLTSLINAEEAMIGMYTDPELIHQILEGISASIIEINKEVSAFVKNFSCYSTSYLPFGIHFSDDNAAFLSTEIYIEFSRKYTEKIGKEFGGVGYHCCMAYEQNLSAMALAEGFIHFDPQVDYNNIDKICEALKLNRGVWCLNNHPWQQKKPRNETDYQTITRAIDLASEFAGLRIDLLGERDEVIKLAEHVRNYASKKNLLIE